MPDLGYDDIELAAASGQWTAREIVQQPRCLADIQSMLLQRQDEIQTFLAPVTQNPDGQLLFAGAGSSAFIGDILASVLRPALRCDVAALATTDIVAAPHRLFRPGRPTLMLSFGRSGNSPESLAAVQLADHFLPDLRHLAISCNAEGVLAQQVLARGPKAKLVALPDVTHDRGFAMTSSFSGMAYAALAICSGIARTGAKQTTISQMVGDVIDTFGTRTRDLAREGFGRVVYLGSGPFKGLAQEAALKLLEMTNGAVVALHDTPLGFRHGPKTIVDPTAMVVLFLSNDPYTRQYDMDLLRELRADAVAARIIAVSGRADTALDPDTDIVVPGAAEASDAELVFPYLALVQMLAFHEAMNRGLSPDNPVASGHVNRVVQGVTIHPFDPGLAA